MASPSASVAPVRRSLSHSPALDGVRGCAVVAVLGFHLGFLSGGYDGVTVFFALSGFLISVLLLQERDEFGSVDFRAFYIRRALRLLPALVAVLAVDTAFVLATRSGYDRKAGLAAIAFTLFYSANWATVARVLPFRELSHTWSLAIEEQFYLIWPWLLIALVRRNWRKRTLALIVAGAAIFFSFERCWLIYAGAPEHRVYYGLDTRADALLFGAAAAFAFKYGSFGVFGRRILGSLAVAAAALLGLHLFGGIVASVHSSSLSSIASYSAVGMLSAVLILGLAAAPEHFHLLSIVLAWRPIRYLGKISYGLYLWHYVLFGIMDYWQILVRNPLARFVIAVLVSAASYQALEKPWLRVKDRFSYRARDLSTQTFGVDRSSSAYMLEGQRR